MLSISLYNRLDICLSALATSLLSLFVYVKISLLDFHPWVLGVPYMFCILILYQIHSLWMLLLLYELSFCFLFCCAKLYNLDYFPTTYFCFWNLCFGSQIWEVNARTNFEKIFFPLCFLQGVLQCWVFHTFLSWSLYVFHVDADFSNTTCWKHGLHCIILISLLSNWLGMYEVLGSLILLHCLYIWLYMSNIMFK